jgi:hypothetical protein
MLIDTYWLLGKSDFPFHVDLQATAELLKATNYWHEQNWTAETIAEESDVSND